MMYPLVLDLADDGFPVAVTCRVLGFSTQAFNKWRRNPVSQRDWDEAHVINAAIDIHDDDPAFGYRFISDELADAGFEVSERRVWRLCSQERIWSVFAKKKGLSRKAGPPVHDDLVGRDFSAERPNALWLTDITEHRTDEGKLYCCAIKDVYSNRIVGYSLADRMTAALAVSALRNAIALRHPVDTVIILFRPWISISIEGLRPHPQAQWSHRIDGSGRRLRRQCGDGVVLFVAPKERARSPALADQRGSAYRHRHLDRTDLSPTSPPAGPRTTHPGRV